MEINPQSLDVLALPWLPLDERTAFPKQPAIYFAIDSQQTIQYIGRANCPNTRWKSHHKFEQLNSIESVKIAYLFLDACLLPEVESALIGWFKPPLNVQGVGIKSPLRSKRGTKVVRTIEVEVPNLGDRIKKARLSDKRSLTQLAALAGMTTANWHRIESEKIDSLPFETLKRMESALGTDFGVVING